MLDYVAIVHIYFSKGEASKEKIGHGKTPPVIDLRGVQLRTVLDTLGYAVNFNC